LQLTIQTPEFDQFLEIPKSLGDWGDDEFFEFCQANRDVRIERTAKGEIVIMPLAGGYSGFESGEAFAQLRNSAIHDKTGIAFDSSTGFRLPNGGVRSPDAAWLRLERLRELNRRQKEQFIPLCPDFLIEVASPSDRFSGLHEKMAEYREVGLPLGLLILPKTRQVEIYTLAEIRTLESPPSVSADPLLPGFQLDLSLIWDTPF